MYDFYRHIDNWRDQPDIYGRKTFREDMTVKGDIYADGLLFANVANAINVGDDAFLGDATFKGYVYVDKTLRAEKYEYKDIVVIDTTTKQDLHVGRRLFVEKSSELGAAEIQDGHIWKDLRVQHDATVKDALHVENNALISGKLEVEDDILGGKSFTARDATISHNVYIKHWLQVEGPVAFNGEGGSFPLQDAQVHISPTVDDDHESGYGHRFTGLAVQPVSKSDNLSASRLYGIVSIPSYNPDDPGSYLGTLMGLNVGASLLSNEKETYIGNITGISCNINWIGDDSTTGTAVGIDQYFVDNAADNKIVGNIYGLRIRDIPAAVITDIAKGPGDGVIWNIWTGRGGRHWLGDDVIMRHDATVSEDLYVSGSIHGTVVGGYKEGDDLDIQDVVIRKDLLVQDDATIKGDIHLEGRDFGFSGGSGGEQDAADNFRVRSTLVTDDATVRDDLFVDGDVVFRKDLTIYDDATIKNDLYVDGIIFGGGITTDEAQDFHIHKDLRVQDDATIKDRLVVEGHFDLQGDVDIDDLIVREDLLVKRDATIYRDLFVGEDLFVKRDATILQDLHVDGRTFGIDHDQLDGFVAGEHISLPNTIANVLTDHNLANHSSLGLYSEGDDIDVGDIISRKDLLVQDDATVKDDLRIENAIYLGKDGMEGIIAPGPGYMYARADGDLYLDTISGTGGTIYLRPQQTSALRVNTIGAMTNPLQPAFSAYIPDTSSDATMGDGRWVTVRWEAEIFDQNEDFSIVTHKFTAPVAGKYLLSLMLRLENIYIAANSYTISLKTSNREYQQVFDPEWADDLKHYMISFSVVADMDANDTAYVRTWQAGGDEQTKIVAGVGNNADSWFQGGLIC